VKVFDMLKGAGYRPALIMGGDMDVRERDEQIDLFRQGRVTMVITTDLLSRGFDMDTI